jgi:amino acid transporter
LAAVTYFIVSGGPYGLEDLVHDAGYGLAMVILLVTPIIWSVPTAFMVAELASAIPTEGGYYIWVRRAFGSFWGFQAAWLSLGASIFDMAIYPTLFVAYAGKLFPSVASGPAGIMLGLSVIAAGALWNLRGGFGVGRLSLWSGAFMLIPFGVMVLIGFFHPPPEPPTVQHLNSQSGSTLLMGIMVAMWNYMGWDNASTIAGEVENPQRTYPLTMALVVFLVTGIYALTVGAAWYARVDLESFSTGGWVTVGQVIGGDWLALAIVVCGCMAAFASFNSLVMSYSRLPFALAEDNLLPKMFLKKLSDTGAPWVSILVCSMAWAFSLGIGFQHLIQLDILLYGASLIMQFAALLRLRIKEPNLMRPFKVPGGLIGAALLGLMPVALIIMFFLTGNNEQIFGINVSVFGLTLGAAGALLYFLLNR